MRRIIVLLIALAIIFTSFSLSMPVFAADARENVYEGDMGIVSSLGIFTEIPAKSNSVVSRGMFLAGVMQLIGAKNEYEKNQSPFYDVTSDNKYYNQILFAAQLGFVNGDENRNFYPDDPIKYRDAIVMLLRALNYGAEYPDGYFKLANRLKITRNIDLALEDNLRAGACARMFLSAGEVAENKITTIEGLINSGANVLWEKHKIAKTHGIITGNEFSSLKNDKGVGEHTVCINNQLYTLYDYAKCYDYLGHNVEIYYKVENDKATILHIKDYRNDIETIEADDVIRFDETVLALRYADGNRTKEIKIPKSASVIYNGVLTLSFKVNGKSIFEPETGKLEFIDNDNDGTYDVVSVTSCTVAVARSANATDKIVTDYYYPERKLDFSDAEAKGYIWFLTDADGNKVKPESIEEYDVITYAKSVDGRILRGVVTKEQKSGKVSATKSVKKHTIFIIGGKEYDANYDFVNSGAILPKVNDEVTILLDYSGKIAGIKGATDSDAQYGFYIHACVADGAFNSKKIVAKILDSYGQGGVLDFEFADKVRIDGETYKSDNNSLANYITVPETYTRTTQSILDNNRYFLEPFQVIMYKTDYEGKVNYIDTVNRGAKEDDNTLRIIGGGGDEKYSKVSAGRHFHTASITASSATSNGKYGLVGVGTNTKFMGTPLYNDIDNYFGYKLYNFSTLPGGNYNLKITAYTTDPQSLIPEMIHVPIEKLTTIDATNSQTGLVKLVEMRVTPEGDAAWYLEYYQDMSEYSYLADYSLDLSDVKVGDIVKVQLNTEDKICALKRQCVFDANTHTLSYPDPSLGTVSNHGGTSQHYIGYNYAVEEDLVFMTKNTTFEVSPSNIDTLPVVASYAKIYVVSQGREEATVRNITAAEMKNIANYRDSQSVVPVFMKLTSGVIRLVVFYE